ncbi:RES family NAD+ phosphorylase [Vreelandella janggokensis]|uniref:RES family NAD+ phosphorylase n=1 Tax=Vreelandella janggokensis TaxID=370767 RepID=UPI002866C2EC|nr:RES family NAD+ phosphorylase [Halomonas janggokensis]MDR5885407.1 RES family NAD+ phosphorylase [Halomonas janggokensis]
MPDELPSCSAKRVESYRLVNSKFPPIELFDDVANAEEFEALYALQALTNPRLRNEVGDLGLLPIEDIPFGIRGCSYATAPFTHVNPNGSRFSDGSFGVLYVADSLTAAITEVKYHQQAYWRKVPSLHYERFVFRGLKCVFDEGGCRDGLVLAPSHPIYCADDYRASQVLGEALRRSTGTGLRYHSVRHEGGVCWALMTPRRVKQMIQTTHLEMIWNGDIAQVNRLSAVSRS